MQRRAWETRPLLRRVYTGWFREIQQRLSSVPGPTVELGAGCGAFKEFMPDVVATDVVESPWADRVADAEELPFDDASVANIAMVDVLHHVPRPASVLQEAERVLSPAGRVIMLEPYCAPLSTLAWRHLHHEELDLQADLERSDPQSSDDPFDSNTALPTLLFWRHPAVVTRWAPDLHVVERRRLAWLVYPLSGGFSKRQLLPTALAGPALTCERALASLLVPLLAFRCLVVLEHRTPGQPMG